MPQSHKLPYADLGSGARPYLVVHVAAPSGLDGPVVGLVDSGADVTSMPRGFASLMGYKADQLEPVKVQQVSGTLDCLRAKVPCRGNVIGLPAPIFDLWPTFVPGSPSVLWGRKDFFAAFASVGFDEMAQSLTLTVA